MKTNGNGMKIKKHE